MSDTSTTILSSHALSIGYHKKAIMENISVEASSGNLVMIIGNNGCGKSTLLKTLCGLIPPVAGDIRIEGKAFTTLKKQYLAKKISIVTTENQVSGFLKVRDLISLGRIPHTNLLGRLTKEDYQQIEETLSLLRIEHLANKLIEETSDGERQKIMIARALVQDTPIIIMDEPTAFLDVKNKYETILLFKKVCQQKRKTILFSSHDITATLPFADYVWFFDKHQIISDTLENFMESNLLNQLTDNKNIIFDKERVNFIIKEFPF